MSMKCFGVGNCWGEMRLILKRSFGMARSNIAFQNLEKDNPVQNFILRRLVLFSASESQM